MDIPDEKILRHMTHFDFGHKQKLSLSFQSWEFPFGGRLEFTKNQTPAEKKALIIAAMQYSHRIVRADIKATVPEIVQFAGDSTVAEQLKEFYK